MPGRPHELVDILASSLAVAKTVYFIDKYKNSTFAADCQFDFQYIPYALCMVYLPTCSIHRAYGQGHLHSLHMTFEPLEHRFL